MDKREIAGGLIWLFFAVLVIISSLKLGVGEFHNPGPGFFPFWSALCLGIITMMLLGNHFLKKDAAENTSTAGIWKTLNWGRNVVIVIALFIYCLVLPILGYIPATLGLMMILFYTGKMKPWAVICASLLAVLLTYCLFYYGLKTPLPRSIWPF
jgi:hypothetical protein